MGKKKGRKAKNKQSAAETDGGATPAAQSDERQMVKASAESEASTKRWGVEKKEPPKQIKNGTNGTDWIPPQLICCHPACSKRATLRCPKCREHDIPMEHSFFCSKECFNSAYNEHKKIHKDPSLVNKDGENSISVEPMPMQFFKNFVPDNALDGSGAYEWSSESRKLFDTKGKIRNRPKVAHVLKEQHLIDFKFAKKRGRSQVKRLNAVSTQAAQEAVVQLYEEHYECKMSHCHWRHVFRWCPTEQSGHLSRFWKGLGEAEREAVLMIIPNELKEMATATFCFIDARSRRMGTHMYFKDLSYLAMWKTLFGLIVENDVPVVVNQQLLFEIFNNVEDYIDKGGMREQYQSVREGAGAFNHAMQEHCKLVFVTELFQVFLQRLKYAYEQSGAEAVVWNNLSKLSHCIAEEESLERQREEERKTREKDRRQKQKQASKEMKQIRQEMAEAKKQMEERKAADETKQDELDRNAQSSFWQRQLLEQVQMELEMAITLEDPQMLSSAIEAVVSTRKQLSQHFVRVSEEEEQALSVQLGQANRLVEDLRNAS